MKHYEDNEHDEDGYYRVVEISCQADAYSSEYIQKNWWFEGDMTTSSLRDSNKIKTEQRNKEFWKFLKRIKNYYWKVLIEPSRYD